MPDNIGPSNITGLLKPSTSRLRAAKPHERVGDFFRDIYQGVGESPIGRVTDSLGLTGFQGVADSYADPNAGVMLAGAKTPAQLAAEAALKTGSKLAAPKSQYADEVERLIAEAGPQRLTQPKLVTSEMEGPIKNNASLNSGGMSTENFRRIKEMENLGEKYEIIDRGGNVRPVLQQEGVDIGSTLRPGESYGIRNADKSFRTLDSRPANIFNEYGTKKRAF